MSLEPSGRGLPGGVVEVLGPAGAGKTTLRRALGRRHPGVQAGIEVSRLGQLPFVVRTAGPLLPRYVLEHRGTRWLSRRETRSMAYLEAWLRGVRRDAGSSGGRLLVFDHGPLYRLALLREFGPEIAGSARFRHWWASVFHRWATTLDLVVCLDAPDPVLVERIRARESRHVLKEQDEREAHEYLGAYRAALERIVAEADETHRLPMLRFDSGRADVDEMADEVLGALRAQREGDAAHDSPRNAERAVSREAV